MEVVVGGTIPLDRCITQWCTTQDTAVPPTPKFSCLGQESKLPEGLFKPKTVQNPTGIGRHLNACAHLFEIARLLKNGGRNTMPGKTQSST